MAESEENPCVRRAVGSISRKRYSELVSSLEKLIPDRELLAAVLEQVCCATNFDPNMKLYTKERGQRTKEFRERQKEKGISTYESSGRKSHYYNHKNT